MVINMRGKSIRKIGVNDASYVVKPTINGKRFVCRFYDRWNNMISRCYNEKCLSDYPSYSDCTVCDEWLTFSKFKAWMEKQDWEGKHFDKDLLFPGSRVYSPETCVFVSPETNIFVTDSAASRGKYMIGATLHKATGKYEAQCNNPFTKELEYLGLFDDEMSAHMAWKKRKHGFACRMAELQDDERVANALRVRYL
jgi:hypothetical protein